MTTDYAEANAAAEADRGPQAESDPAVPSPPRSGRLLPLEAKIEPWSGPKRPPNTAAEGTGQSATGGWSIELPVRAERITVEKQTMITEAVTVRKRQVEEVMRLGESVARERLRVEARDDLRATQPTQASSVRPDETGRGERRT